MRDEDATNDRGKLGLNRSHLAESLVNRQVEGLMGWAREVIVIVMADNVFVDAGRGHSHHVGAKVDEEHHAREEGNDDSRIV